jgi:hypothetical protein
VASLSDRTDLRRRAATGWPIAVGVVAAIVAAVVLRTAVFGWSPVAPDDARYLFVGLSVLSGDGPVTPAGAVFLLRSPVYGVALAAGSTALGGDPIVGAEIVALGLAIACLLGAIRLGWLLAGSGGAAGTTLALLATPIVWRLVGSLRIDLPQTAGVIAILLAVWRPTTRGWALGGILFGLTILVKETVLPLGLLPLALLGLEPPRRVATFLGVYLGAALLVAGWWWVAVWLGAGVLFPLNAIGVIAGREVGLDLRIARPALVLVGLVVAAWLVVAARARTERGPRLLAVAAACLVPAALYAASQGLNARNYAGLAVLSAVALGVAGAWSVAWIRGRVGGSAGTATPMGGSRRIIIGALVAVLALGVVGGVALGQRAAGKPATAGVSDDLAAWLRTNTTDGDRVAMTFRDRESMALRLFGSVQVANLTPVRVDPADDLATYLWLGLRDRQLFGFTRSAWIKVLTRPPARYLVLSGPHPFTPSDLGASLAAGRVPGLAPVATLDDGVDQAQVFTVDASTVAGGLGAIPLHATADAAMAWLDLAVPADDEAGAVARLLAVEPIISGAGLDALLARVGDAACVVPFDLVPGQDDGLAGAVQLRSAEACRG